MGSAGKSATSKKRKEPTVSFIVRLNLTFSAKASLLNEFFSDVVLIGIDEMEKTALAYLICSNVCG